MTIATNDSSHTPSLRHRAEQATTLPPYHQQLPALHPPRNASQPKRAPSCIAEPGSSGCSVLCIAQLAPNRRCITPDNVCYPALTDALHVFHQQPLSSTASIGEHPARPYSGCLFQPYRIWFCRQNLGVEVVNHHAIQLSTRTNGCMCDRRSYHRP